MARYGDLFILFGVNGASRSCKQRPAKRHSAKLCREHWQHFPNTSWTTGWLFILSI